MSWAARVESAAEAAGAGPLAAPLPRPLDPVDAGGPSEVPTARRPGVRSEHGPKASPTSSDGAARPAWLSVLRGGGAILAERVSAGRGFAGRIRGLVGIAPLSPGYGRWIEPCRIVHTLGIGYAVDVIFVDAHGQVLQTSRELRPWRAARGPAQGRAALVLPAGSATAAGLCPGDQLWVRASMLHELWAEAGT